MQHYWNQENFEGLASIAEEAMTHPHLRLFADYCQLKSKGLRKPAAAALAEFIRHASTLDFPARRITLNLAAADLPKDGGRIVVAIALGILAASGQLPAVALEHVECLGELALSGAIRPVQGILPAALAARAAGRALVRHR